MCGRYRRTTSEEEIARQYHIPIPPQLDLPISYNVAPTQNVLAIRRNPETGERTLDALRWGVGCSNMHLKSLSSILRGFVSLSANRGTAKPIKRAVPGY
jgi:putative SOS response-associated peptidase YedK